MAITPSATRHHQAARTALTMTAMAMTTRRLRKRETNRVSKPMSTPSLSFKLNRLGFLLAMIRDAGEIGRQNTITNTNTTHCASSSPTSSTHTVATGDYHQYMYEDDDYYYSSYSWHNSYMPDEDAFPRSRHASISSAFSCEGLSNDEMRELWMCMLELQMRYGCYNSTRMHLAVNAGDDAMNLMPNPFILDTLNNSVVHLPDEGWEMLSRHLRHGEACML